MTMKTTARTEYASMMIGYLSVCVCLSSLCCGELPPMETPPPLTNWTSLLTRPFLKVSDDVILNVTSQVGDTTFLSCPAPPEVDDPVWIRRSDYHILSGGTTNYIPDARFQVLHDKTANDWTLQIKFIDIDDQGVYECQISEGDGFRSRFVRLLVYQPVSRITSGPDYHVQQGTTILLVCIIQGGIRAPSYVFWYHGERMINYDSERGGITVETLPDQEKTVSTVSISDVTVKDSGNYSCRPSHSRPSSVHVYVSQGDNTAAIQRIGNSVPRTRFTADIACIMTSLLIFINR